MAILTDDLAHGGNFIFVFGDLQDFYVQYVCAHTGVQEDRASISKFVGEFTQGCLSFKWINLESISSSGDTLTTPSMSVMSGGANMDWTINLCLLFSLGS
uniref:Uncharacterized protein n=1 Tax=Dicentrarchus labrax TaxID=13489 RepID=A0A8C4HNF2_DICLA